MVAYLAPSHGNPDAPDNVVARVYGRDIMKRDLDRQMGIMIRSLGRKVNLEALGPIIQSQALSRLVQGKLVAGAGGAARGGGDRRRDQGGPGGQAAPASGSWTRTAS